MKIAGIVAEYNPFHNGHALHIAKTREMLGEDASIVCVMSGNFIQRGETAILEKHVRAAAALCGGADLVLELPCPWAVSSAERFAYGAMALLDSLGCVDNVSFGCECGDAGELREAAALLLDEAFGEFLRAELRRGGSFAAARQAALERMSGRSFELLEKPNNILAVEYIKALMRLSSTMEPLAILRHGAGHDEAVARGGLRSASAIRAVLAAGGNISGDVPRAAMALYSAAMAAGRGPVTMERAELSVLTRLRTMSETEFARLPDMSEGLHLRLMRAARNAGSLEELYESVKTKRYALARIRRAVLCAWLGISAADAAEAPPYARVLAANGRGRAVLKAAKKNIPVITKPALARRLDERGGALFELEARADDLYALCFAGTENRRGGQEWELSPVICD